MEQRFVCMCWGHRSEVRNTGGGVGLKGGRMRRAWDMPKLEIRKGHERAHSQAWLNVRIRNSSKIPVFVVATGWRQSLRENEQSQERKEMG